MAKLPALANAANKAVEKIPAEAKGPRISLDQVEMLVELTRELARRRGGKERTRANSPFRPAIHPPAAMPPKDERMAFDSNIQWAEGNWLAGGNFADGLAFEGLAFPGYSYLSELAQRPEYRVISETIADDATRKWIDFEVTGDEEENAGEENAPGSPAMDKEPDLEEIMRSLDPDERKKKIKEKGKTDKVKALVDEMERLDAQKVCYDLCRLDGLMGRSHLYFNFGEDADGDPDELATPVGDGRDETSRRKIAKGSFKELKVIEAIWTYPMAYNATSPLKPHWYDPQTWYVMGTRIDASRLQRVVGRPVPDMLKPAYSFGGLSLSQMAEPYVDIWLRTRTSVAEMIHAFSVMVLSTDLQTLLQPGTAGDLLARAAMFNALRDNMGLFVVNKSTEDFKNVSAPVSGLSDLQAQALEHMSTVSRIPLVKLTGISPKGLNACLPGDTLILTARGQVPIRDVALSDRVMTRRGLAPLVFSGITKYATELIEIRTSSASVKCTANHPIWLPSTKAFVPAENVRHGDLLLLTGARNDIPKMRRPWHGVGNGGGRTRTDTTSHGTLSPSERCTSIVEYGKHIAGLFRRAFISTTSTAIRKIIRSPTLSRCAEIFMPRTMASNGVVGALAGQNPYFARSAASRSSSRNFPAGRNFVVAPVCSPTDGRSDPLRQKGRRPAFASCAERLSAHLARALSFVRESVQQRAKIAPNTIAHTISLTQKNTSRTIEMPDAALLEPVVSVRRISASGPVYDLTVAPGYLPEFFANRILTHNSSEGEILVYDDTIGAYQTRVLRPPIIRIVNFAQLSLWGEIDPEITFKFSPLRTATDKERGEKQKNDADRDEKYVNLGAISSGEVRKIIINDPDLPYTGLDPDEVPDLQQEEEAGLMPGGGEKGGGKDGEGGGGRSS